MGKKIVVITGSPRRSGNSFAMTEAFINAAEERGNTVTRFDAAFLNIAGCKACECCFKNGEACITDDEFNLIARAVEKADDIIFTMPVYWYTIPSQLKAVIDRLFSFCSAGRDISGKGCGIIACCEENDMTVLDGVKMPIERTAALLKWHMIGEVLVPGVFRCGDIADTDGCAAAAELASRL